MPLDFIPNYNLNKLAMLLNKAFPVVEFSREGYKIRKVFG